MDYFRYVDGRLFCEDTAVSDIAREVGTPFYLYSERTLRRHFRVFDEAFDGLPHIVCFAMKANPNAAVAATFASMGSGADVVSGGELYRALRAGVPAERIVYAGVGKTVREIEYALKSGILMFNVESGEELTVIDEVAGRLGVRAPVALRVNPDVDPNTHPYISTGLRKNKFGIPMETARDEYMAADGLDNLRVVGIHQHIGSQITETAPFTDSLRKTAALAASLKQSGLDIRYMDVGGGLGIRYLDEDPPRPSELAAAVKPLLDGSGCTLILEPGRVLAGNAGCLVTSVLYRKSSGDRNFVIVDAGMNDLLRPALYDAYHEVRPVEKREGGRFTADLVGPICESGDFLARGREMRVPERGELFAVMSAGAYGFSMSSNYNSRPRPPEVMVEGGRYTVVRRRETFEDLVRCETTPGGTKGVSA